MCVSPPSLARPSAPEEKEEECALALIFGSVLTRLPAAAAATTNIGATSYSTFFTLLAVQKISSLPTLTLDFDSATLVISKSTGGGGGGNSNSSGYNYVQPAAALPPSLPSLSVCSGRVAALKLLAAAGAGGAGRGSSTKLVKKKKKKLATSVGRSVEWCRSRDRYYTGREGGRKGEMATTVLRRHKKWQVTPPPPPMPQLPPRPDYGERGRETNG